MQVWSCGPVVSPWAIPSALVGDRSICGNLTVSGQVSCGSLSIASGGSFTASGGAIISGVAPNAGGDTLWVQGVTHSTGDITGQSNLAISGLASIDGGMIVSGVAPGTGGDTLWVQGVTHSTGNITGESGLNLLGPASIGGDFYVAGNTTLFNTTVDGNIRLVYGVVYQSIDSNNSISLGWDGVNVNVYVDGTLVKAL